MITLCTFSNSNLGFLIADCMADVISGGRREQLRNDLLSHPGHGWFLQGDAELEGGLSLTGPEHYRTPSWGHGGSSRLLTSKSQKQKTDFSWDKMHLLNCFFGQPAEAQEDLDSRENDPLSSLHLFLPILKAWEWPLRCQKRWLVRPEDSEGLEVGSWHQPSGLLFKVRKNYRERLWG